MFHPSDIALKMDAHMLTAIAIKGETVNSACILY